MFAGQIKIESNSTCRTRTILQKFCPLLLIYLKEVSGKLTTLQSEQILHSGQILNCTMVI